MVEQVVSSVMKSLNDLLIQEANFLHGVSGKVEQMQTELELMRSYLEDADKKQDEDKIVQTWVSQIREAAYDAEAVVETYALKIASRRRGGIRNKFKRYACITNEAFEIHKVGSEIEAIIAKISNLKTSLQTYGITLKSIGEGSSSARGTQRELRRSYSHVVEDYTVGLDENRQILVAQLVDEEKHCGVVSICGMGGLGKTTLAKKIYHDSVIRGHFEGLAWASISQQFQTRDVWEGILFKLISPSVEERRVIRELRDEELAKKLYKVQEEKKSLVILDDIWTTNAWDRLSPAFPPMKAAGTKMLLTTRNKEVALHVDPSGLPYEPRVLTHEEGWELLKKAAFPGKDNQDFRLNRDMEELGSKMVERCGGLPLAITVLGGLLATKQTFNEWMMIYKNMDLYLREGKGHDQLNMGVSWVLASSYHDLPYRLKPCFLHLGHFPEDFDIHVQKLIRMWVGEGIVLPMQHGVEGEETIEDIAEHYLGELVDRCMVQVAERSSSGRVKTCRLHDLMRDLCLSKVNQEIFLRIVDLQDQNKLVDFPSSTVTVGKSTHRRFAIYGEETLKFFPKQESTPYLRSLLFFKTNRDNSENFRKMVSWFSNFKLLKVLDLERRPIEGKLPREIGNLIHLRYLSVDCSKIPNIPSSIGNLRCLQTLVLDGWNELNVPNVIWKMVELRHLYFTIFSRSGKLGLGDLRNLQTLQRFNTRNFNVEELNKLTNLRKLVIDMLSHHQELKEILKSPRVNFFDRLRSLKIDWSGSTMEETDLQRLFSACHNLYNLHLIGRIVKLPEYPQFPKNLTKLTLRWSGLKEDPMPTLEKLPYLTILCLYMQSFIGKEMVCSSKGFPQLKYLLLRSLYMLEEWRVGEEEEEEEERCVGKEAAMPNLCELKIESCCNLKKIPNGLRFITTLRKLEIRRMLTRFTNRLQQGGEDYDKVQHVPSITFEDIYMLAV